MKKEEQTKRGFRVCVKHLRRIFSMGVFCSMLAFCVVPAPLFVSSASASGGYLKAFEVSRSEFAHVLMSPGSTREFTITFKNTGTRTWDKEGANRVAINTTYPLPRHSQFQDSSWTEWWRPAKLPQDHVAPGETATFSFSLHAPLQSGEYIERFSLVGLPEGEIPGGDFAVLITVGDSLPGIPLFRGKVLAISDNATESFAPGQSKTITVTLKNTGRAPWTHPARSFIMLETAKPRLRESSFVYRWRTPGHPNYMLESRVDPGETVDVRFALEAPETEGAYAETFQLVAKGLAPIEWTTFTLNLTVKTPDVKKTSNTKTPATTTIMDEPDIRVGITSLNSGVELQPKTSHTYRDTNGKTLYQGSANEVSTVTYTNGTYTLSNSSKTITSGLPIRVTPDDGGVTSVLNYRTYYDTFRGIIEVRYATATKKLWVVNELPFEQYLAGLAEAVSGQNEEYIKALAVAARSYALWHYFVSSRHANENYTINSTTDQVYKGYYYEQKIPDFKKAVEQTRGLVMTHPSAGFEKNPLNIALGAYSSGTDGRTRNFTDVFGGKPEDWEWMVSVDDPYGIIADATTRPGNHMVGMSANGALGYAVREHKTYDWILQHYYSGVALTVLY